MLNELLDPRTLARLERLVQLARRVPPAPRRGLRRAGRGIEPGSRRDYSPGDDVRLVDWPAFARLERLLLKVQEELPAPRLDLLLDGSASMGCGHPSPHLRAALAASALAACAVARQVQVVTWWAGEPLAQQEVRRPGQLVWLLRFLAERAPRGDAGGLARCVARMARTTRIRGGAVLLTDGLDLDATTEAASRLRRHGFSTLVVVPGADQELGPDQAEAAQVAGLTELVDAETGRRRQLPWSSAAAAAAAAERLARREQLARRLEEAGVSLEELGPGDPFETVALGLLRRGPLTDR